MVEHSSNDEEDSVDADVAQLLALEWHLAAFLQRKVSSPALICAPSKLHSCRIVHMYGVTWSRKWCS